MRSEFKSIIPPTIVLRHRRENLKKCSLRGLEDREDMQFYTYPIAALPSLEHYLMLSMEGPLLTQEDADRGIFLIDATWRYAERMERLAKGAVDLVPRRLPDHFRTAYPRRQDDCQDPERGLASIEALYITYRILGRDCTGLLDGYYWRDAFLDKNGFVENKQFLDK